MMLCGLVAFYGCKEKTEADLQQTTDYTIEKSFYKGSMRVQLRLSSENIKLSDLLQMELVATFDPDYTIEFPAMSETLKQFSVHNWKELPETVTEGGKTVKTHFYQLEPLEMGMCEIPALTFAFERKEPSDAKSAHGILETEAVWVDVSTSLSDDPNAMVIADIEDVVEIKADHTWVWIGLGVICLLAAGGAVGLAVGPKKTGQARCIYQPAHEIAFAVLQAIAGEKLVEQGRIKEFYEKLSGCLRQYIENRFQLRAPEQTTEEFLEQLKTSDALKLEHKQELERFLGHCDLVKFARYQPSNEQINESLTMAESFIERTKSVEHQVEVTGQGERQGVS
jgi:hypothetical protein